MQIFDNALLMAGLIDDPRVMIKRLNQLVEVALSQTTAKDEKQ